MELARSCDGKDQVARQLLGGEINDFPALLMRHVRSDKGFQREASFLAGGERAAR